MYFKLRSLFFIFAENEIINLLLLVKIKLKIHVNLFLDNSKRNLNIQIENMKMNNYISKIVSNIKKSKNITNQPTN